MSRITRNRSRARREEITRRQIERKKKWDKLTTQQKLNKLPKDGANKQRIKLLAVLEKEKLEEKKKTKKELKF